MPQVLKPGGTRMFEQIPSFSIGIVIVEGADDSYKVKLKCGHRVMMDAASTFK